MAGLAVPRALSLSLSREREREIVSLSVSLCAGASECETQSEVRVCCATPSFGSGVVDFLCAQKVRRFDLRLVKHLKCRGSVIS